MTTDLRVSGTADVARGAATALPTRAWEGGRFAQVKEEAFPEQLPDTHTSAHLAAWRALQAAGLVQMQAGQPGAASPSCHRGCERRGARSHSHRH